MSIRREEIESIVSEVLLKLGSQTTVGAPQAGPADQGDWGVFERLEDAVSAAQIAYKRGQHHPAGLPGQCPPPGRDGGG